MRILLVRPSNIENINTRLPESLNRRQGVLPPLGISYIAAALEGAGHEVGVLDVVAMNMTRGEVRRRIEDFGPKVTGITTMTPTLFGALEAAKMAKEAGSTTVLGGPQLAIYPEETLSYPYVDYGIAGEGEHAMLELIEVLEGRCEASGVGGLIYKRGGKVCVNGAVIVDDIDSLPFPAYHLLPMSRYSSIIGLHPVSTMVSTRGCPYNCSYCFKQPSDRRFRCRRPASVVDEMAYLVGRYKVNEVMFYDDVMALRRDHITGICDEILSRGLKVEWETPTRIEHVDGELLKLMRRAGCIRLRYGVESGDEEILKMMNKRIDFARVREVFRLTREAGIETFAYFMIGYAHETDSTIKKTIDFALELDPDLAMFTAVTPLPRTPLYDQAQREGMVDGDYWREFTLGGKKGERIPYLFGGAERHVKEAYRRFYLRPSFIFKRLRGIRSWDSFKKHIHALQGISKFEMEAR